VNLGLPERNYDPALSSGITTGQRTVPVFPNVRKVRCSWAETDLHKTHGLSTARGGGGVHCEVIGIPRVPGDHRLCYLMVRCPASMRRPRMGRVDGNAAGAFPWCSD